MHKQGGLEEIQNQKLWDEITPVHLNSYDLKLLYAGKSSIDSIHKRELYPVAGKSLLHLQCHIGTDSLGLALDGARVLGVDFSAKSVDAAIQLNKKLGLDAKFLQANVVDLIGNIDDRFDIVYTSRGVLNWISDIDQWAAGVAHHLNPGGTFYIQEEHPVLHMFGKDTKNGINVSSSYFHTKEPQLCPQGPDYSDKSYTSSNFTFEWTWSMSDVINALLSQGLQIQFINEYSKCFYPVFDGMSCDKDGWWTLPDFHEQIPLMFTLKAVKA